MWTTRSLYIKLPHSTQHANLRASYAMAKMTTTPRCTDTPGLWDELLVLHVLLVLIYIVSLETLSGCSDGVMNFGKSRLVTFPLCIDYSSALFDLGR